VNPSVDNPASRMSDRSNPRSSAAWSGMDRAVGTPSFFRMMWRELPTRTTLHPPLSKAATVLRPEMEGRRDIYRTTSSRATVSAGGGINSLS
jgi:hypothetical protein